MERKLEEVKKCNAELEYRVTKRWGELKLKSDELKMKDQTLTAVTQGFENQLDKAKQDIKLGKENVFVIKNAYKYLVSQAIGQFYAVVHAVKSLWPDLDMARLEQALSHPAPQSPGVANVDSVLPATGFRLPKASQSGLSIGSPTVVNPTVVAFQADDSQSSVPGSPT